MFRTPVLSLRQAMNMACTLFRMTRRNVSRRDRQRGPRAWPDDRGTLKWQAPTSSSGHRSPGRTVLLDRRRVCAAAEACLGRLEAVNPRLTPVIALAYSPIGPMRPRGSNSKSLVNARS
jgi:hypothetical protein